MNERLKKLRAKLELSQEEFGNKIGIGSRAHISLLENGTRNLTDRVINDICREFNVNENWLRYGKDKMFIQDDEFSLDEYARKNNLTELELEIVKNFMSIDPEAREEVFVFLKKIFPKNEEAVTEEERIDDEVENYRLELEAELKGETSSASENLKEKSN